MFAKFGPKVATMLTRFTNVLYAGIALSALVLALGGVANKGPVRTTLTAAVLLFWFIKILASSKIDTTPSGPSERTPGELFDITYDAALSQGPVSDADLTELARIAGITIGDARRRIAKKS